MAGFWFRNLRFDSYRQETKNKVWRSAFALEVFEEVMRNSPTFIGIFPDHICWDNTCSKYGHPDHKISFTARGYKSLRSKDPWDEVSALEEYFIKKSNNAYRRTETDAHHWPAFILVKNRINNNQSSLLKDW